MPEHTHETEGAEETSPSGGAQMDDINIPLVAVSVAFFACLLAVTIISLQAWFMNADRSETSRKTLPQEDPRTYDVLTHGELVTPLGQLLQKQRAQLLVPPAARPMEPVVAVAPATTATTASQPVRKLWIPIDTAMELVSKDYSQGSRP